MDGGRECLGRFAPSLGARALARPARVANPQPPPTGPVRSYPATARRRCTLATHDRKAEALDSEGLRDDDVDDTPFDHFLGEGFVTEVVRIIKTGKEASVHLCRANRSTTGEDLVALKLYHPLGRRDFRDESIYRDGEWIPERRIRAALEKKTRFGRHVQGA